VTHHHPFSIIGFHSCDREVGLRVLNGKDDLQPSVNPWDWLAEGIYFWEQNPGRAMDYARESASKTQFNKKAVKTPFVLGAIIELGHCLNLVDAESLAILSTAYEGLKRLTEEIGEKMPVNKGANRALDCAVIKYIHESNKRQGKPAYDTIRCAFPEGTVAYPGTEITSRLHIQICIRNKDCVKGYFLPRPLHEFNPYLSTLVSK
jgi:hypothetical protein